MADSEQTRQIFKLSKRRLFIDVPGNGVMMAIPLKSVAGGRTLGYLTDSTQTGGKPAMDFSHELIMVIMNEGYSDTVMDAARSAGAGGGTVLHAKGTGRARAQKFFGVSLADEKDVVYIVAHADEKAAIMQAIADNAGPGTRAGRHLLLAAHLSRSQAFASATNKKVSPGRCSGLRGIYLSRIGGRFFWVRVGLYDPC